MLRKVVGQATSSGSLETVSKLGIAWNILYVVIYVFILFWTLYTLPDKEDKLGYKGYSFISQIKYCGQLYGASALLVFINLRVTYYREDIRKTYSRLLEMLQDFKALKFAQGQERFEYTFLIITALILSPPIALLIDVLQTSRSIPVVLWICLYVPGFSCVVYICNYIDMFFACSNRFQVINTTLEDFAYLELSCTEIYSLRKSKIRPEALLKTLSANGQTSFDKLLMLYDETCELTQLLNETCGLELAAYFAGTAATIISLSYTAVLDLIAFSRGDSISEANTRACNFWAVINFFALIAVTTATTEVKQNCAKTPILLHRLFNIYVDLEPLADIYSLQMNHQSVTVKAAGFFPLDKSIFLGLLSTWVTYLIILIQFNG